MESYDPKTNKYPYPEFTCEHYLKVREDNGLVFDKNYPYYNKDKKFLRKRSLLYFIIFLIVFPVTKLRLGLKIYGKENLKKHKEVIENGIISCSNHVHLWDYLAIMLAIRPKRPNTIAWAKNIRGENSKLMRLVGCIPIPENDMHGTIEFMKAIKQLLSEKCWLHIYPEGSMWEFYKPIRPFKSGAFSLARMTDKPVLPMAFSYRKPSWIRRKIFKQIACFNLSIGEPIFIDKSLSKNDSIDKLTKQVHDEICKLSKINPNENIYPYKYENTRRIDYYTDTYGTE